MTPRGSCDANIWAVLAAGVFTLTVGTQNCPAAAAAFGPSNPFYAPSALPFHAPPFDKIKDADYQPAIEAGMARQLVEIAAIVQNHAPATFENTFIPLEQSGRLLDRATAAFSGVTGANTNPVLQQVKAALAPKLAAHHDAIYLNEKLFARVAAVYAARASQVHDPESRRLVEVTYEEFVHSGAKLPEPEKAQLRKLNEEASVLSDAFTRKLLAANKDGAYVAATPAGLAGFSDAQLAAAAEAAQRRQVTGYLVPLQNTTQQPALATISVARDPSGDFPEFLEPRRTQRCERYARDHRPPCAAACRACAAARLPEPCGMEIGRSNGEDSGRGARVHGCARARGHGQIVPRGQGPAGFDRFTGRRVHARAVGLGLLQRAIAPREVRSERR